MTLFASIALLPVRLYRVAISPFTAGCCRFYPTCSAYCAEAIKTHGLFKGGLLTLRRLLRCQPWGGAGLDPVPSPPKSQTCCNAVASVTPPTQRDTHART